MSSPSQHATSHAFGLRASLIHQLIANIPAVRFLDLIKPFTPLLPEVAAPETNKVPFNQKLMWTGVCRSSSVARSPGWIADTLCS